MTWFVAEGIIWSMRLAKLCWSPRYSCSFLWLWWNPMLCMLSWQLNSMFGCYHMIDVCLIYWRFYILGLAWILYGWTQSGVKDVATVMWSAKWFPWWWKIGVKDGGPWRWKLILVIKLDIVHLELVQLVLLRCNNY